jgi:hypothetical protein
MSQRRPMTMLCCGTFELLVVACSASQTFADQKFRSINMSELSYKALFAYFARNETGESSNENNNTRRSKSQRMLRRFAPYLGGLGAIALVGVVLAAIYFTWLDWQWITFFAGILIAAVLSLASRSVRA